MDGESSAEHHRRARVPPLAVNAALALVSLIALFAFLELTAASLVRSGLVEIRPPMETVLVPGAADFRLWHITADHYREPDPVLFWRPKAEWPYTKQRFKGPLVTEAKPPGFFRILCYGDSNTDGPPLKDAWPARLQRILAARRGSGDPIYEVLNAGVSGYSSHQGLLRFRQEARRYSPDLVLVSFGWNDLATALGAPDHAFDPPTLLVSVERVLLNLQFYRLARQLARSVFPPPPPVGPRVPPENYLENMRSFAATAREIGAEAVFLTRPYRERRETLESSDNWRSQVPRYNDALRQLGRDEGLLVVDAESFFAERPDRFVDECHFTEGGGREMALFVHGALAEHGKLSGDHEARPRRED